VICPLPGYACLCQTRAQSANLVADYGGVFVALRVDQHSFLFDKIVYLRLDAGDLRRLVVVFQFAHRAGFVHDVNRLVRHETPGNKTFGKFDRKFHRRVGVAYAVMLLVFMLQTPQYTQGFIVIRLFDEYRLETALKGGVLLKVFAVFGERCRADTLNVAARQPRFEHIGSVNRSLRAARPDYRMNLVYKHNDISRLDYLAGDFFQPLFKLAPVLGSRHNRPHVKGEEALAGKGFRRVFRNQKLRKPFDNGGFAHPGFADQYGVVFGAPRENTHDAFHLVLSADDRVKFAGPREGA